MLLKKKKKKKGRVQQHFITTKRGTTAHLWIPLAMLPSPCAAQLYHQHHLL